MYSIVILHLYTLWCDYLDISRNHLLYKVIMIFLTIFPVLYSTPVIYLKYFCFIAKTG